MKRLKVAHVNFNYNKAEFPYENELIEKLKIFVRNNKLRKDRLYFVTLNENDDFEVVL